MSSDNKNPEERSVGFLAAGANLLSAPHDSASTNSSETMKRAAAKQLIEKYYYQLTDGCGDAGCNNEFCASSSRFCFENLSRNDAAVKALEHFKNKTLLCDASKPSKIARSVNESNRGATADEQPSTSRFDLAAAGEPSMGQPPPQTPSAQSSIKSTEAHHKKFEILTERRLSSIISECGQAGSWTKLVRIISQVFFNPEAIMSSFLFEPDHLTKEDLRSMESDQDKDTDEQEEPSTETGDSDDDDDTAPEDSEEMVTDGSTGGAVMMEVERDIATTTSSPDDLAIDLPSVRRAFAELFALPDAAAFQVPLINAITYLSRGVETDLRSYNELMKNPNYVNIFLVVMEIPQLDSLEFLESATPTFCKTVGLLPMALQARLARVWATVPHDRLRQMVRTIQQLITVKVIMNTWTRTYIVNDDEGITGAAKLLKILYYASILGGRMDPAQVVIAERTLDDDTTAHFQDLLQGAMGHEQKEKQVPKEDPLGRVLSVHPMDCREPAVPLDEFVNESLSDAIEMDKDYTYYKAESASKFTFMQHAFLLTTAVKNMGMYFDNRIRMMTERRASMMLNIVHASPMNSMPYLRLRIRRDHIIDDALINLEMVAMDNPQDLKKQLFVEFEGEQGIDEGGVSKEFFQLVVEELFNPDIGMFILDEETQTFWFNAMSFENDAQFTLIGIVLGLAIYNNVILDIHFPMVVYRKLMGKLGIFEDLKASHPTLAKSLQGMLDYEGDVEDAFMQPFCIGSHDVFGNPQVHHLKENGDQILVTNETRQEFVELYTNFLLNKSVEKQFRAFKRGFQMVTDESPLKMLFHPDEIELLVCGSKNFDFQALEDAAEYDGGFTSVSPVIRYFWETIHEFNDEQKRQLLQFTTGSDRVPIGGLSKLKIIIARNGPDSDRLPTSHTCFNVLLLPDYRSKEKLQERLLKAIYNSKGFGML